MQAQTDISLGRRFVQKQTSEEIGGAYVIDRFSHDCVRFSSIVYADMDNGYRYYVISGPLSCPSRHQIVKPCCPQCHAASL
jgi:hypothetical protein